MLIILPAAILSATIIIMLVMIRRDVGRGLIWSAATIGSTAAIIVSLFLVRAVPIELVLRSSAGSIFNRLPLTMTLDETAWSFQTSLLAILSAVLLTVTRRQASSGPGAWLGLLRSVGGFGNDFITKKIELPRNWDKLVAKYKDLVPTYAPY